MRVSIQKIQQYKDNGERFPVLTAYDYPTAKIIDEAEVPMILVGDSLGNVVLGYESTVFVTMSDMLHHTKAVVRGSKKALVLADMPFMSYHISTDQAKASAGELIKRGNAQAVKMEVINQKSIEVVRSVIEMGIPVMGHLGFTPQSVYQLGGYRVQGKTAKQAEIILKQALSLQDAGCSFLLLEGMPRESASLIASELEIPVYGIGAGDKVDGQLVIFHDLMGLFWEFKSVNIKFILFLFSLKNFFRF